jgi:basic amino acid/polyamine antiporter, APA family
LANPDQPARVLGAFDAFSVVVGGIVGVGIFFTPSRVAQITGSGGLALLAWAIAGAIVLCGALALAELGGLYHGSGAHYTILRDAYGPLPAFLYVFCNATAIQAGAIAIIAIVCAINVGIAAGGGPPQGAALFAIAGAMIVGLTAANIAGVRVGSGIQNVTALAKVLTLLAVTVLAALSTPEGAPHADAAVIVGGSLPHAGVVVSVLAALVPAFFTFGGWQQALWIAGEVREPRRTLPRALVGGVLAVIVVYLLANWAYLRLLGAQGVAGSQALAADAVAAVWPSVGRRVVAAAVAVSAFGVLNAQLLSGPRLVHGMARDGRFFPVFGVLGARTGTPVAAIALIGGMALLLLLAAGPQGVIGRLLNGVVFIDGIFFVLTGAALFVLRRTRPDADRPVRVPGYPVVPLVFVIGEVGVVAGSYLDPEVRGATLIGLAWIAAGAVLYAVRFRERGGEPGVG